MTNFPGVTRNYLIDLAEIRTRYEAGWLEPAKRFIASVAPRMANLEPSHKAEPRINGSIRRVNREVWFSKISGPIILAYILYYG